MSEEQKEKLIKNNNETVSQFDNEDKVEIKGIVTQINKINILASDHDVNVKGDRTFVIHSGG